jgi:flagellar motor switch protein FliN/FliY
MAENATATATAQPMVEQSPGAGADVRTAQVFGKLAPGSAANAQASDIDMILDIPVQLTVELGRTKIPIRHILQLSQGSVVELDGLAGAPMDVFVNGCLIAQGEVVAVNDKFGIRITDVVTPSERMRKLNR